MRKHRARGQLWAFVYLAVRGLFDLFFLSCRSQQSNSVDPGIGSLHDVEKREGHVGSLPDPTEKCQSTGTIGILEPYKWRGSITGVAIIEGSWFHADTANDRKTMTRGR